MEATLENKLSVQVQSGSVLYSCDRKALIGKHGLKNVACRIEKRSSNADLVGLQYLDVRPGGGEAGLPPNHRRERQKPEAGQHTDM